MGTRKDRLDEAVLTRTHNLCFEQEYEKYQKFLSENLPLLVVKFSMYTVYLKRRVSVMLSATCNWRDNFYELILTFLHKKPFLKRALF